MEEIITQRMRRCAICGESFAREAIAALINLQSSSGVGAALAAHRACVLGILHPTARATLTEQSIGGVQSSSAPPI